MRYPHKWTPLCQTAGINLEESIVVSTFFILVWVYSFINNKKDNFIETEESKELTLAQEETIKKTLEEIRKQDPKKNKRVYPIVVFGDEYDDKDVYIAYFREPDFIAFSKFVQLQKKDEIAAVRSLAHDTFIQGDKELVDDDSLFLYGLSTKLVNIIGSRQAKVANFSIAGK